MQRADASTVELSDESPGTVEVKAEDEAEVDDRDDGTDLELFIATWYITSAWDKRPFLRSNFAYHSACNALRGSAFKAPVNTQLEKTGKTIKKRLNAVESTKKK